MLWIVKTCVLCGRGVDLLRHVALPETKRCVECARKWGSDIQLPDVIIGMDAETYRDLLEAVRS